MGQRISHLSSDLQINCSRNVWELASCLQPVLITSHNHSLCVIVYTGWLSCLGSIFSGCILLLYFRTSKHRVSWLMMNESTESKRRRKLTEEYLESKLKDMLLPWLCRQSAFMKIIYRLPYMMHLGRMLLAWNWNRTLCLRENLLEQQSNRSELVINKPYLYTAVSRQHL